MNQLYPYEQRELLFEEPPKELPVNDKFKFMSSIAYADGRNTLGAEFITKMFLATIRHDINGTLGQALLTIFEELYPRNFTYVALYKSVKSTGCDKYDFCQSVHAMNEFHALTEKILSTLSDPTSNLIRFDLLEIIKKVETLFQKPNNRLEFITPHINLRGKTLNVPKLWYAIFFHILHNFVSNTRKCNPAQRDLKISIKFLCRDDKLYFIYKDNGKGIGQELLRQDIFSKGVSGFADKDRGKGLYNIHLLVRMLLCSEIKVYSWPSEHPHIDKKSYAKFAIVSSISALKNVIEFEEDE